MRKQIAAANWKMNLTLAEGEKLIQEMLDKKWQLGENQSVTIAVPFVYLTAMNALLKETKGIHLAAQNLASKASGAYTGEVSAAMLQSIGVQQVLIGHSERREYYHEDNAMLAEKINLALANGLQPFFCCGESLDIREAGNEKTFVEQQLSESLFHLKEADMQKVVVAYEPIWAIGTGKTASSEQAQEMHAHIRNVVAAKYGELVANGLSILYGGSVKAANAKEIFGKPDVDGGLVGGASLNAEEFSAIVEALK